MLMAEDTMSCKHSNALSVSGARLPSPVDELRSSDHAMMCLYLALMEAFGLLSEGTLVASVGA
jgi:hypothetical protein